MADLLFDPVDPYRVMARYNGWMNRRLYAAAGQLSDEERKRDQRAFFRSVHGTFNHLLLADRVWLGRITQDRALAASLDASGAPIVVKSLDQELYGDFDQLRGERERTDQHLLALVDSLDGPSLTRPISYRTMAGVAITQPLWWLLQHIFNHQTHHRGQVTTLFMQLGRDPGVTDLIAMLREEELARP
jgi:uncharacterized damage-inducible protein DinB